jgi:hypothetical protein
MTGARPRISVLCPRFQCNAPIANSAARYLPDGHPGDAFLRQTAAALHAHFDIDHPTMQIEIGRPEGGCAHPLTCPAPP